MKTTAYLNLSRHWNLRKVVLSAATLVFAAASFAIAQEAPPEDSPDPEIAKIHKKYELEYKKLEEQGKKLTEDAPKGPENAASVDFDFSKMHDASFDVPEFRMKRQRIVLDIPTGTMKTRRIVWHNPEVTMERRKVGQYPVFRGTTVRWKDIITHVPVTKMVKREAKLDIPEFRMNRTEMSFDIPEIFRTRRVKLEIPEIKVRTTDQAQDTVEAGSNEIEKSANAFATAQKQEILSLSLKRLNEQKSKILSEQKKATEDITNAIAQARKVGADPTQLTGENEQKINLVEILDTTNKQFQDGLAKIDEAMAELRKQLGGETAGTVS